MDGWMTRMCLCGMFHGRFDSYSSSPDWILGGRSSERNVNNLEVERGTRMLSTRYYVYKFQYRHSLNSLYRSGWYTSASASCYEQQFMKQIMDILGRQITINDHKQAFVSKSAASSEGWMCVVGGIVYHLGPIYCHINRAHKGRAAINISKDAFGVRVSEGQLQW